jgi:RHS repeat-associated protein
VVDTLDPKNGDALIGRSKHYFYGNPLAPSTVYATDYTPWQVGREYQTDEYAADGTTLLRSVTNSWQQRAAVNWWTGTSNASPPNDPRLVETTTTLADTNQVTKHSSISPIDGSIGYDRYNNPTDTWEYDFGAGGPGALLRHTQTAYVTLLNGSDYACDPSTTCSSNANLTNAIHVRSLPDHTSVFDSNGVEQARTSFEFDNYNTDTNHAGLLYRASISGLDSAFTTSYTTRGNLTAATQYLLTNGTVTGSIASYGQYDMAGNVVKAIDARGNSTNIDFSDNFGGPADTVESGGNPVNSPPSELGSLLTYAFPFKVTNSLGPVYTKFDYYLGRPDASEDLNGIVSSAYSTDVLDRPTQVIRAVNDTSSPSAKSQSTFAYDDVNHIITTTSDQNTYGDNILTSKVLYDGLGRTTEKRQYEDSTNYIAVQMKYDGVGRAYQTSSPFRSSESIVWTTSIFDALGRVKTVTTPDGAVVSTLYSGNRVLVADQTNRKRLSVTDGLGRLREVWEITAADPATEPVSFPGFGDVVAGYVTRYDYDTLDDLTGVSQRIGASGTMQTRSFAYDSLRRLKSAMNPEMVNQQGQQVPVTYQYDNNGNLTQKTDARGVVTTFDPYDAVNRPTRKSYSDGTPAVTYAYDTLTHGKGRLTSVSSNISSYVYGGYDAVGRALSATETIYGSTNQSYAITNISYDLAGHLLTMKYPSQDTITNTYDNAGRLQSFSGTLGDGLSRTYSSAISYASMGGLQQEQFGTATAVINKLNYNSRGQLAETLLGTGTSGNTAFNRGKIVNDYSLQCSGAGCNASDNNGNLRRQTLYIPNDDSNGSPSSWYQQYEYDSLNRLTQVHEITADSAHDWQQVFNYDRYGNRTIDYATTTNNSYNAIPRPQFTVDTNTNRLGVPAGESGTMTYDYAGNLTVDTHSGSAVSRAYDAENRMTSETTYNSAVAGSYSYDGDGRRVRRIVGSTETQQVYGLGGELLAEYSSAGVLQKEYGYRNGQLLITADVPVTSGGTGWGPPPAYSGPDPLAHGDDIKLENLTQLRSAVNSLREHAGLSDYNFTVDPNPQRYVTGVSADHILQLRQALEGARSQLGLPTGGYAHPGLHAGDPIYAIDFQELRQQIRSAWSNGEVKLPLVAATSSRDHSPPYDASHAINNNLNDLWSAGDYAPQWIQVDLGQVRTISRVRLLVDQSPSGHTTHQVYGGATPDNLSLLGTFDGDTVFHQWLELAVSASNIRYIKVSTTLSSSWVGWAEIEVYGPGVTQSQIHWLVPDQLGTPRMILDASGSLANETRHDYLPFGEELGTGTGGRTTEQGYSASDGVRQQFTGQQRDNETGLDYFNARYYASMQGRFISTDPVLSSGHPMNPQSWDRYSYVGNNPLKLTDPNGEMWIYEFLNKEHTRIGIAWIDGNKIPKNLLAAGYHALNFGGQDSRDITLTNGSVVRFSATSKNPLQLRGPQSSGGDGGYVNAGLINGIRQQTAPMPAATAAFILVSLNGGYAVAGSSIALLDAAAFALNAAHEQSQNDGAVMAGTSTLYDDSGTSKSLKYHGARQIETDVTKSEFIDNLVQSGYKMSKQGNETILEKGGSRYTVYDVARSTGNPAASLNIGGAGESLKIRLKP